MDVDYGFDLETDYLDQHRWYADVYQTESSAEASPLTPPSEIMEGLFPAVPCDFTPVTGYTNPYETPIEGRAAVEGAPYKSTRQVMTYGVHAVQPMTPLEATTPYYYQPGGSTNLDTSSKKRSRSNEASDAQTSNQRTNAKLRTAARKPRKQSVSSASAASTSPTSSSISGGARIAKQQTMMPSSPPGPPPPTEEVRRARHNHNLVEKQYRNRLNGHFERLIAVLPPTTGEDDDDDGFGGSGAAVDDPRRRLSKAEVLDLARRRIKLLEKQNEGLRQEREMLASKLGRR